MPRIIPRLLKSLKDSEYSQKTYIIPNGLAAKKPRKSLYRPVPSYTFVHPATRSQSILLDPINPIVNAKDFVRHKTLPPRPVVPKRNVADDDEGPEVPRMMTEKELDWWSSPYLRMISSRLRRCVLTERYLPSDFLIRVVAMRLPTPRGSKMAQTLLPDGLQHHKFSQRKVGFGHYFICWKDAMQNLTSKKLPRRSAPNISVHPFLAQQVGHLLRVRVLQELELLARSAKRRLKVPHSASVRRLTRNEWKEFKLTGVIRYPNAIALLVVPPLNKDLTTKERPIADASVSPQAADTDSERKLRPMPPLSTLHPITDIPPNEDPSLPDVTSTVSVPMYNGLTLFPSRSQRAALYERLCAVLRAETPSRHLQTNLPHFGPRDKRPKGDGKFSHAFLICSDATTVTRADTVPLTIALWRVRMWEGGGWENTSRTWAIPPS